MAVYPAALVRLIDADTLILRLLISPELGIEYTHPRGVRLLGIDAPESNTEAGKAATAFVAEWLPHNVEPYCLTVDVKGYDKYGRVLGAVYRNVDNSSLKDALLARGFGYPMALAAHLPERLP